MSRSVTGTFGATGQSVKFPARGAFNVSISGTFVGTVDLQRSFDDGTTWHAMTGESWTAPVEKATLSEPEDGVHYRFDCSAYTSGTVTYRLSQ